MFGGKKIDSGEELGDGLTRFVVVAALVHSRTPDHFSKFSDCPVRYSNPPYKMYVAHTKCMWPIQNIRGPYKMYVALVNVRSRDATRVTAPKHCVQKASAQRLGIGLLDSL